MRVPVHPGNNPALIRTRNSDRIRRPFCLHPQTTHRDSIELVAVSATLPGTTRFETLVLETSRRRDRRRSLDRNRACLLWSVTLHYAENGIHGVCHSSLQKLNTVSLSERLPIRRDIRTWGLVFEANPQIHRLPSSVPDTTSNDSITKALGKQSFRFHKKVLVRHILTLVDCLS